MLENITKGLKQIFEENGIDLKENSDNSEVFKSGTVIITHEATEQLNFPLNDFSISFIVQCQTLIEEDEDKNIIKNITKKIQEIIQNFDVRNFSELTNENILAIKFQNSFIQSDAEVHVSSVNFELIVTEFFF